MKQIKIYYLLFVVLLFSIPINSMILQGVAKVENNPKIIYQPNASDDSYEDDDSFETAENITLNTIQDRSIYPIADPDFIAFELDTFYGITIKTNNSQGDTRIWLYDYQRVQLAFDDNINDDDLNASIYIDLLKPGIYFIKVEETGNDAEIDLYSISIIANLASDPYESDSHAFVYEISLNCSSIRNLYPVTDVDYHYYTLTSTFNVTIEITGTPGGDTVMEVNDFPEDGSPIAFDDDSGKGLYSKIELTNQMPGIYYITIWEFQNNHIVSNYTLHLTAYSNSYSDTVDPSMSHNGYTLSELAGEAAVEIQAYSWDAFGISEVILHYRVNSGTWAEIPFVDRAHYAYWYASIGPFDEGDFIEYYLSAKDNSSNRNEKILDNSGEYYNFTILYNDFEGPSIEDVHCIPVAPNDLETIIINSTISDEHGIYNATLFYRINSGSWLYQLMSHDTGDIYLTTIGPFEYDDFIEFFINAIDNTPINYNLATNNNGGNYFNFTIGSSDNVGPTISLIEHQPSPPDETDLITISCSITDFNDVYTATLFFRVNLGDWINISLTLTTGSIYEATIGTFNVDDYIEYYLTATDNYLLHNLAIDNNSDSYYSFTIVRSDVTPPVISDITLSNENPIDRESVNISCIVTDENGIHSVILHFRINGKSWYSVQMILIAVNHYSIETVSFNEGDYVEYYIEALDESIFHNIAIDDNGGSYYSFSVSSTTIPSPTPTTTTTTTEESILFLLPIIGSLLYVTISRKKK